MTTCFSSRFSLHERSFQWRSVVGRNSSKRPIILILHHFLSRGHSVSGRKHEIGDETFTLGCYRPHSVRKSRCLLQDGTSLSTNRDRRQLLHHIKRAPHTSHHLQANFGVYDRIWGPTLFLGCCLTPAIASFGRHFKHPSVFFRKETSNL